MDGTPSGGECSESSGIGIIPGLLSGGTEYLIILLNPTRSDSPLQAEEVSFSGISGPGPMAGRVGAGRMDAAQVDGFSLAMTLRM